MNKRDRLVDLLRVESVRPKKYTSDNKQIVVMPAPIQKRDLTDYEYGKNIDEKVVKMAISLAEKMAITIIRESAALNVDEIVNKVVAALSDKIAAAIPEQRTIIQQVVSQETPALKKEMGAFAFEGAEMAIDRSKGHKLHGKIGSKSTSTDNTDDALSVLEGLTF
jgi:hypothetical protein